MSQSVSQYTGFIPWWLSGIPYLGDYVRLMRLSPAYFWDTDRRLKTEKPDEALAQYRQEFHKMFDLASGAQGTVISLADEIRKLRAENEFMLRLINQHMIGVDGVNEKAEG